MLFFASDYVPLCFFMLEKPKTIYEQAVGQMQAEGAEKRQVEIITFVLKNGIKTMNTEAFDVDLYMNTSSNIFEALYIYQEILNITFLKFREVKTVPIDYVCHVDRMAKRYGKTPIEVMFPCGGYSDWDAYVFNSFIFVNAYQKELTETKRQIDEMRAGR